MTRRPAGKGGPPDPDHPRRCVGTSKRTGQRCRGWGLDGTEPPRCRNHAGVSVEQAHRKADERRAIEQVQRMVARAGVERSPIDHLLDTLHLAAQLVAVWGSMVADLDNAGAVQVDPEHGDPGRLRGEVRWTRELVSVTDKGERYRFVPDPDRLLTVSSDGVVRVHPYVEQYERWVEKRARYAALAIRAGVDERLVKIREREADALVDAIDAAIGAPEVARALGVDTVPHAARTAARKALAARLRELHDEAAKL